MKELAIASDKKERVWHVGQREDGSVVIYMTRSGSPCHYVVFDELDERLRSTRIDDAKKEAGKA